MRSNKLVLATLAFAPLAPNAWAQATTLESVDAQGKPGAWVSQYPTLTPDGRYLAFHSESSNLVAGDLNGARDLFLRDRQTGAIELVTIATDGSAAGSGVGDSLPAISADGQAVVFASAASNLVASDTNAASDVFLRDRQLATTIRLSLTSTGGEANATCWRPAMSRDARFVVYESDASNLVPGDTNNARDVFLLDRQTGVLTRESIGNAGEQAGGHSAAVSDDGRYVAFITSTFNLVPNDLVFGPDIFVRDRQTGQLELVTITIGGGGANGLAQAPTISPDGRYVAFQDSSGALVAGDNNSATDVFLRDRLSATTELISVSTGGGLSNSHSSRPAISADARWVAFTSSATNLVASDTNSTSDAYLRDRVAGTTTRVGVAFDGAQGNTVTHPGVSVSDDGRWIAFWSHAANLVYGDTNTVVDVFVRDTASPCAPMLSYCSPKITSTGCAPLISATGAASQSESDAFFLIAQYVPNSKNGTLIWSRAAASTPFGGGTLCIAPPIKRTAPQDSGTGSFACAGRYSYHFSQAYMQAQGVLAGETIYAQYWFRDNGFAPPDNIGLTQGLAFTACP